MKTRLVIFAIIGIFISGSIAYVWAEDAFHTSSHLECFELWKIPKFEKFGSGFYVSCIDIITLG